MNATARLRPGTTRAPLRALICAATIHAVPALADVDPTRTGFLPDGTAVSLSLAASTATLENRPGFDVDGTYGSGGTRPSLRVDWPLAGDPWTGDASSAWRLSIARDVQDFDGLEIASALAGADLLAVIGGRSGLHAGIGAGLGVGIARTASFHDDATHALGELSVTGLIGLGRLELGLTGYVRSTGGATLDERDAAPRTTGVRLALAWRVWERD